MSSTSHLKQVIYSTCSYTPLPSPGVEHCLRRGESLGDDDDEGLLRVEVVQGSTDVYRVDVREKTKLVQLCLLPRSVLLRLKSLKKEGKSSKYIKIMKKSFSAFLNEK